jgi:ferrochelatase
VVQQIAADGHQRLVGLCMAPHASRFSTGAYRNKLEEAVSSLAVPLRVSFVNSWHDQPQFIHALANNARAALAQFSEAERNEVHYLFTAHSLPASIIEQGDPYAGQIYETARLVAQELGLQPEQWSQCFQSAGRIPGAWLGPQIDEVIPQLAAQGIRSVLVQAVGFVADHVEVLYDLDIEACALAKNYGIHLRRAASPNTAPEFIDGLAQIVTACLAEDERLDE